MATPSVTPKAMVKKAKNGVLRGSSFMYSKA